MDRNVRSEAEERESAGDSWPIGLALPAGTPPHPGRYLEAQFLRPLGMTQTDLATALAISRRRVNELVRGRRAMTADTAFRLGAFFGNDALFWMHLQVAWDMHAAVTKRAAHRR